MSEWRKIPARDIKVGDIVSVLGITSRRSAIVHVNYVDATPAEVVVYGRQPWGGGWREVTRVLHPEGRADLLVEDDDPYKGKR